MANGDVEELEPSNLAIKGLTPPGTTGLEGYIHLGCNRFYLQASLLGVNVIPEQS